MDIPLDNPTVLWFSSVVQAVAGLIADAREIVSLARDEAANYRFSFAQPVPLKVSIQAPIYSRVVHCIPPPHTHTQHLVDRVSGFMHIYTLYSSMRPFGCSVIFASCGPEGPCLYMADPSGVAWVRSTLLVVSETLYSTGYIHTTQGYSGCAVGKARQAAKTELEKLKVSECSSRHYWLGA